MVDAPVVADSFEGSAATPLKPPKPEAAPKVEAEPKIGVGEDACGRQGLDCLWPASYHTLVDPNTTARAAIQMQLSRRTDVETQVCGGMDDAHNM